MIELYDYQKNTIDIWQNNITNGIKNNIIQLPTGAGKTIIALHIIKNNTSGNTLFIADRIDIINQTDNIVRDNHSHENVILITPQALLYKVREKKEVKSNRKVYEINVDKISKYVIDNNINLIFIDECHVRYEVNVKLIEIATTLGIAIIGLSATPYAEYLCHHFHNNIIIATTMNKLVNNNKLIMPTFYTSKKSINFKNNKSYVRGGEYDYSKTEKELIDINYEVSIAIQVILKQRKRRIIIFGTTLRHCDELCLELKKRGIRAVMYTGFTSVKLRLEYITKMKASEIDCLVSVDALTKGFDLPIVDCIIDCKPILCSINNFIQGIGRATRIANGKTDALYVDFVGNRDKFLPLVKMVYDGDITTLEQGAFIMGTPEIEPYKCKHCKDELPIRLKPKDICWKCGKMQGRECQGCLSLVYDYPCNVCGFNTPDADYKAKITKAYNKIISNDEIKEVNNMHYIYGQIKGYVVLYKAHFNYHTRKWYTSFVYEKITGKKPDWQYEDIKSMKVNKYFNTILKRVIGKISRDYLKEKKNERGNDTSISNEMA